MGQMTVDIPELVWSYQDHLVYRVALRIVADRDYTHERMCVLADALEEAGYDDAYDLEHLRSADSHPTREALERRSDRSWWIDWTQTYCYMIAHIMQMAKNRDLSV